MGGIVYPHVACVAQVGQARLTPRHLSRPLGEDSVVESRDAAWGRGLAETGAPPEPSWSHSPLPHPSPHTHSSSPHTKNKTR